MKTFAAALLMIAANATEWQKAQGYAAGPVVVRAAPLLKAPLLAKPAYGYGKKVLVKNAYTSDSSSVSDLSDLSSSDSLSDLSSSASGSISDITSSLLDSSSSSDLDLSSLYSSKSLSDLYDSYSSDYSNSDYYSSDYSDHDHGYGYRRRYGNRVRYMRYRPRYNSGRYLYGRRYASKVGIYKPAYKSLGYRSYGYGYRGNHGGYRAARGYGRW